MKTFLFLVILLFLTTWSCDLSDFIPREMDRYTDSIRVERPDSTLLT